MSPATSTRAWRTLLVAAFAASRLVGLTRLPAFVDENLHLSWAMHIAQGERLGVGGRLEVGHEGGVAHEVRDGLLAVALQAQAEVLLGHGVHPLDAVVGVEHQHAVGHGLARLPEAPQGVREARSAA